MTIPVAGAGELRTELRARSRSSSAHGGGCPELGTVMDRLAPREILAVERHFERTATAQLLGFVAALPLQAQQSNLQGAVPSESREKWVRQAPTAEERAQRARKVAQAMRAEMEKTQRSKLCIFRRAKGNCVEPEDVVALVEKALPAQAAGEVEAPGTDGGCVRRSGATVPDLEEGALGTRPLERQSDGVTGGCAAGQASDEFLRRFRDAEPDFERVPAFMDNFSHRPAEVVQADTASDGEHDHLREQSCTSPLELSPQREAPSDEELA